MKLYVLSGTGGIQTRPRYGFASKLWKDTGLHLVRRVSRLRSKIEKQYDILEGRLSREGQMYLALKDRPTIADIATLPFADEACATLFGLQLSKWPHTLDWSRRMAARPAVLRARERVSKMGHDSGESYRGIFQKLHS